jgi:putative NADPH-quinone reductase
MAKNIAIIIGHPDPDEHRFCRALAKSYSEGAQVGGHVVETIDIAKIDFPFIRTKDDFDHGQVPECIRSAQELIRWSEHIVLFYPLWLGTLPAYLQAFLEQTLRPGFAANEASAGKPWEKLLGGRAARVVVTMGMPAFAYRWFYFAHSLKNLERNILGFCGIGPVNSTLIGMIEGMDSNERQTWLKKMRQLGTTGS